MVQHVPPLKATERRAYPRLSPQKMSATLESRIFLETVSVLDIGRLGFAVRTMITYPPGEKLWLHIPGQDAPFLAEAVWHSQMRLGARFSEPLSEELLLTLTEED